MQKKYRDSMKDNYHILHINRGIERFEAIGTKKSYPKGYRFDFTDRSPNSFFVIKTGQIIAYEISHDGKYRVYNIMASGSLFLEEYTLFSLSCPVIFETVMDSEIIEVDRCSLVRAMKTDIDLVLDVMESLSEKFVSSMEQLRLGPRQDSEWKICRMLLSYANTYGVSHEDGVLITQKVSHQMIADLLGMNRVTVSRKLKELTAQNLIRSVNGRIFIPDPAAISSHMHNMETQ